MERCDENYNGHKVRRRQENPKTTHTSICLTDLEPYENKWDIIIN